jgi:serine phosphatase RsbU (regulator of sigma subunit)
MKYLIVIFFTLTLSTALGQPSDSLYDTFKNTTGRHKIVKAFQLADYWYNQRNDSSLYFLDYVINNTQNNESDTIRAYSLKLKGNLHFFGKEYGLAALEYEEALTIFNNAYHRAGIEETLNNLGLVMTRQNKFDEAINYMLKSLEMADENKQYLSAAKTMHNMAYVYEKKSNNEAALGYYLKSLEIKRKYSDSASVSSTLNNIGNIYSSYREYNKALAYYEQSLIISRYLHDSTQIALRYKNMARIYREQIKYEESMEYYLAALEIYKNMSRKDEVAAIYNSLGILYSLWERNDEAIGFFKQALDILKPFEEKELKARINNNIAECYENTRKMKMAEKYYKEAMLYFNDTELYFEKISTMQNYATLLGKMKRENEALQLLNEVLYLAEKKKDTHQKARTYQIYSSIYVNMDQYKSAIVMLDRAIILAENTNSHELLRSIYETYYQSYKQIKNYKKALEYHEKAQQIHDNIYNIEVIAKTEELEKKYRLKQKEKEITLLLSKNELQKTKSRVQEDKIKAVTRARNLAYALGLLFFVLLTVSINAIRTKKRANNNLKRYNAEINEQKEEISTQRDEIETQFGYINEQNKILQDQKQKITDSINYAQLIQKSILPNETIFTNNFAEHFILYRPKDIVSGDFYFGETQNNYLFLAAIDCTGHGVPGAFISLLGYNALRTAVKEKQLTDPAKILQHIDRQIISAMHGSDKIQGSGMDIILLRIDTKTRQMKFSGAKRPLIIIRNNELHELPTTRRSIGGMRYHASKDFTTQEWKLKKNDHLYLYTDGYADQFGGNHHKKFKSIQFKNTLHEIQNMQLSTQKKILISKFDEWKGENEQIDDILVIGITI